MRQEWVVPSIWLQRAHSSVIQGAKGLVRNVRYDETTSSGWTFPEHRARGTQGLGTANSLQGWRGETGPIDPSTLLTTRQHPFHATPPSYFPPPSHLGDSISHVSQGRRHRRLCLLLTLPDKLYWGLGTVTLSVGLRLFSLCQLCSARFLQSQSLEVPPTEMVET